MEGIGPFVVYGTTESGDDWHLVFKHPPSEEDIVKAFKEDPWLRDEYDAECIQGWDILDAGWKVIDNEPGP